MEYLFKMSLLTSQIMMVLAAPFITNEREDLTEETIADMISSYNTESASESLFNYLEINVGNSPSQNQAGKSQTIDVFIKETECLKSENWILTDCAFKRGGEVKKCTVSIVTADHRASSRLKCETMPELASNNGGAEVLDQSLRDLKTPRNKETPALSIKNIDCLECIFTRLPG